MAPGPKVWALLLLAGYARATALTAMFTGRTCYYADVDGVGEKVGTSCSLLSALGMRSMLLLDGAKGAVARWGCLWRQQTGNGARADEPGHITLQDTNYIDSPAACHVGRNRQEIEN